MTIWLAGGGTGGHLYPALAIARALRRASGAVEIFFIGARRGIEREVLPESGFDFELLELHPLYRANPWLNARTLRGAVSAWRRLDRIAATRPPSALVATGGYAAGVALAYAARRGVPIVIQEQNSVPGLTVRLFATRAAEIHAGFPEVRGHLPRRARARVVDTGNPIDPPPVPRPDAGAAREAWGLAPDRAVLLIVGGSQGAAALNRVVAEWLAAGGASAAGVGVLWVTGRRTYEEYRSLAADGVVVVPYISPMERAYAAATIALARAGAMTSAELAAWGIPAVFVPLPTAAADHQTANAGAIAAAGAAVVLRQSALDPRTLGASVARLVGDETSLAAMRRAMLARARPNAADAIAERVLHLAEAATVAVGA